MAKDLKGFGNRCDTATGYVDHFWITPTRNIESVPPIVDDLDIEDQVIGNGNEPIYLSHVGDVAFKTTVGAGQKWVKFTPKKTTCQYSSSLKSGDTDFYENKIVGMMANDSARARSIMARLFNGCNEFAAIVVYDQGASQVLIGNQFAGLRISKMELTTAKRGGDLEFMSETSKMPAMYTGIIEE